MFKPAAAGRPSRATTPPTGAPHTASSPHLLKPILENRNTRRWQNGRLHVGDRFSACRPSAAVRRQHVGEAGAEHRRAVGFDAGGIGEHVEEVLGDGIAGREVVVPEADCRRKKPDRLCSSMRTTSSSRRRPLGKPSMLGISSRFALVLYGAVVRPSTAAWTRPSELKFASLRCVGGTAMFSRSMSLKVGRKLLTKGLPLASGLPFLPVAR